MRDKGYGIKHIREQLKVKGFTDNNDLGLINTNDISLMESIRTDVGIEVKNQLKDFLMEFKNLQEQIELQKEESRKIELELVIDEHNQMSEENMKKHIDEKILNQSSLIKNEFEKIKERDVTLVENLRETLKDEKIKALEFEIEQLKNQQPKSFIYRIFHLKK